jgi:hypothetical protein
VPRQRDCQVIVLRFGLQVLRDLDTFTPDSDRGRQVLVGIPSATLSRDPNARFVRGW